MSNASVKRAMRAKQDEFYTQLDDIEDELRHYKKHFKGKNVYLNCDDPERSNFWKYFADNFDTLGLNRLVSTHYHPTEPTYKMAMERGEDGQITAVKTPLEGNGDFRSEECVALLDEADIVCTNPPFSLFREYITQLEDHGKKFLIIGSQNAFSYKEVFPLLKQNDVWLGVNIGKMEFEVPADYVKATRTDDSIPNRPQRYAEVGPICWFTNLDHGKTNNPIPLVSKYDPDRYPKFDNYDAIEVGKVKEIPADYYGVMGVPITYMSQHCPEQFEIIGLGNGRDFFTPTKDYVNPIQISKNGNQSNGGVINRVLARVMNSKPDKTYYLADNVDGYLIAPYARILIRRVDQPDGDHWDE